MRIECLIFVEGDDTPAVFEDIKSAVVHAIDLVSNKTSFDVIPASKQDWKPFAASLRLGTFGADLAETLDFKDQEDDFIAQLDEALEQRLRLHWDAKNSHAKPRQYHDAYRRYYTTEDLQKQKLSSLNHGRITIQLNSSSFPEPEPVTQ